MCIGASMRLRFECIPPEAFVHVKMCAHAPLKTVNILRIGKLSEAGLIENVRRWRHLEFTLRIDETIKYLFAFAISVTFSRWMDFCIARANSKHANSNYRRQNSSEISANHKNSSPISKLVIAALSMNGSILQMNTTKIKMRKTIFSFAGEWAPIVKCVYVKLYAPSTVIAFDVSSVAVYAFSLVGTDGGLSVALMLRNQSGSSKYIRSSCVRRECDVDVSAVSVPSIWLTFAIAMLFSSVIDITMTTMNAFVMNFIFETMQKFYLGGHFWSVSHVFFTKHRKAKTCKFIKWSVCRNKLAQLNRENTEMSGSHVKCEAKILGADDLIGRRSKNGFSLNSTGVCFFLHYKIRIVWVLYVLCSSKFRWTVTHRCQYSCEYDLMVLWNGPVFKWLQCNFTAIIAAQLMTVFSEHLRVIVWSKSRRKHSNDLRF